MSRLHRSLLCVALAPLLGLASPVAADSHESTETKPAPAVAQDEGAETETVAGGRDISEARSPRLVWTEMVEIRDKMDEIADDRDMRALVLTPQEQALFVAFSKRIYDLSKELTARTKPDLDPTGTIATHRAMRGFRSSLGQIRSVAASPIHKELPEELRKMTLQLKGVWESFPDAETLLGPEALPPVEELRYQYPK